MADKWVIRIFSDHTVWRYTIEHQQAQKTVVYSSDEYGEFAAFASAERAFEDALRVKFLATAFTNGAVVH